MADESYSVAAMREEMLVLQEKTARVLLERNPVDKVAVLLDTVQKLAGNIVAHPEDASYRKLDKANATIVDRVLKLKGGEHFLLVCGWEETPDDLSYTFHKHCDIDAFTQGAKVLDDAVEEALECVAAKAVAEAVVVDQAKVDAAGAAAECEATA